MDLLFPVRHHRHIAKQIGIGVSYDWKVLEYSQWGNLSTYFTRRAIRGAEVNTTEGVVLLINGISVCISPLQQVIYLNIISRSIIRLQSANV